VAPSKVGAGLVAAMILSPMVVPLLPVIYLGYVGTTLVHHRIADARAPDAGWVMERPRHVLARLHAMSRAVSGDFAAATAAAAEMISRQRTVLEGDLTAVRSVMLGPAGSVVVARAADYAAGRRPVGVERAPALLGDDGWGGGGGGGGVCTQASVTHGAFGGAAPLTLRSSLAPRMSSRTMLGSRPTLRPGPIPVGLHSAATLARAESLGLGGMGLGGMGLGSLLLPGGGSFTSLGSVTAAVGRRTSNQPPAAATDAASFSAAFASPRAHAVHSLPLPPHAAAAGWTDDDFNPFAAVQSSGTARGGGGRFSDPIPEGRGLHTLAEECGGCGTVVCEGRPSLCIAEAGSESVAAAAAAVAGDDWDASPFASLATADAIDCSPFAAPAPLAVGATGTSVDSEVHSPPPPGSPAAGNGDEAELRSALDSVAEPQRRALLAGRATMPDDHEGVLVGGFRNQQEWMAKQLRKLTWRHVDADVGNVRSHAAGECLLACMEWGLWLTGRVVGSRVRAVRTASACAANHSTTCLTLFDPSPHASSPTPLHALISRQP